jgi:predicted transcriptional regulator
VRVAAMLEPRLADRLARMAHANERTVSAEVRRVLREYVETRS